MQNRTAAGLSRDELRGGDAEAHDLLVRIEPPQQASAHRCHLQIGELQGHVSTWTLALCADFCHGNVSHGERGGTSGNAKLQAYKGTMRCSDNHLDGMSTHECTRCQAISSVAGLPRQCSLIGDRQCVKHSLNARLGGAAGQEGADEQRVAADEAVVGVPRRLRLGLGLRLWRCCVTVAAAALRPVLRISIREAK